MLPPAQKAPPIEKCMATNSLLAIPAIALLLAPLAFSAEATHYHGMQHFPNAYLHEQDGDYIKLRQMSYVNSDGQSVYLYSGPNGEDHNPAWASQTTLRFGQQFSIMVPQPKDNSLKMPTEATVRIEGPGNNDDFAYSLYKTGHIQRTGDAYKFTGYQRITFMLDAPDSLSAEDWTASDAGKSGMLVWLDLSFADGTSMRYLLVAKIIGYDCEPRGWTTSGGSCTDPAAEMQ